MNKIPENPAILCHRCQKKIEWMPRVLKSDECPHCFADLHACKMCSFYDISAYNECREPSAERVVDKEKSNFCDYFKLIQGRGGEKTLGQSAESLKNAADALFKN